MTVLRTLLLVPVLGVLVPLAGLGAAEDAVFPIKEESILDEGGGILTDYLRYGGASIFAGSCTATPNPGVEYPDLKSTSPLYGQVSFRDPLSAPSDARTYYFVLDGADAAGDKYDVLYFDANGDRDLTNDVKIERAEKPPTGLARYSGLGGAESIFDCVELKGATSTAGGERYLPWMSMQSRQRAFLVFMSTVVRKGKVRIGQQSYEVLLGNRSQGSGARVMLRAEDTNNTAPWKSLYLNSLQQAAGEFFTMSVDARGERLTVSPYRGEFGELKMMAVDDAPEKQGLAARLYKSDRSTLALGDYYAAELPREHRFPAGDYRAYLMVDYGNTRASLSTKGYDMQIRSEQPFLLKFTEKPIVSFTAPNPGQTYRPGDRIQFKSMLQDRATGMLVRGLYDTTKTIREGVLRNADGTSVSYPVYASLVPTVTVTDASGKEVASGQMPFG